MTAGLRRPPMKNTRREDYIVCAREDCEKKEYGNEMETISDAT